MDIKVATLTEWEGIARLMQMLQNQHAEQFPDIFKKDAIRGKEYFLKTFSSKNKRIFVAIQDEKVIGFVKGKIIHEEESEIRHERLYGYMDSIFVEPAYRGKLIDQKLFSALFRWFKENGVIYAEGGVWEFNEGARAVFEAMGSKTFQRKQRIYI